jgi:hypothetical protein
MKGIRVEAGTVASRWGLMGGHLHLDVVQQQAQFWRQAIDLKDVENAKWQAI